LDKNHYKPEQSLIVPISVKQSIYSIICPSYTNINVIASSYNCLLLQIKVMSFKTACYCTSLYTTYNLNKKQQKGNK